MLLRNLSRRLITVNGPMSATGNHDEHYPIKPGDNPAVEVPSSLCTSDFVQHLLKTGDLIAVAAPIEPDDLEALRDEAMLLGVTIGKGWNAAKLRAEIDKVNG